MSEDSKVVADSAPPKRKPPAAGKGRPKGATNKLTRTIKEAIEVSFDKIGGPEYLAEMAYQQPAAYMTLLGKVLPAQVQAEISGAVGLLPMALEDVNLSDG